MSQNVINSERAVKFKGTYGADEIFGTYIIPPDFTAPMSPQQCYRAKKLSVGFDEVNTYNIK